MTAFDDDELARALAELPVGEYAPLEQLHGRARQLHTRRRLAGAGLVVAAAVLIAVPSALAFTGDDGGTVTPAPPATTTPTPTSTPSPTDSAIPPPDPDCPLSFSGRIRVGRPEVYESLVASPAELPDELRLLWAPDAAGDPVQAFGLDNRAVIAAVEAAFEDCPPLADRGVVVVVAEGDVVEHSARVYPVEASFQLDPADVRTLDVDGVQVRVEDPVAGSTGPVLAEWEVADTIWRFSGFGLTDAELADLVRTMRLDGDTVDVSDWSVVADSEQFIVLAGGNNVPSGLMIEIRSDEVSLTIDDVGRDPWLETVPGDRAVDVGGNPGILRDARPYTLGSGVWLRWQPTPTTTATLVGDIEAEEVLAIARSIGPVAADDPRLAGVWSAD